MKSIKNIGLLITVLIGMGMQAQTFNETIKEEKQFPSASEENLLVVNNVHGFIKVEGYDGKTVQIEAKKHVEGNNQRQLEQGKAEVNLKVESNGNIIYVYLNSPYTDFDLETGRYGHSQNWTKKHYKYTLDITIKVPKNTSIELSTINDGVVEATNIDAKTISANNINGPINLKNIAGKTFVNALNKDINISYTKNPTEDSTYKSLNGDINIQLQKGLNADVSFKSLNGDIFTNMDTKMNPTRADMKKNKGKRGTKYKMNSNTNFTIGNGGVQLDFDLLNGDVSLKS